MSDEEARSLLTRVFGALFDPAVTAADVGAFFADDYEQIADGNRLDRAEFIDHVQVLKDALEDGAVTFEKVAAGGSTIATMHFVRARKKSGEDIQFRVLAFFEIENGLIQRTEEMTRLVAGADADRDLGSRISA